ncbi:MAG: KH domain-containing protein [Thermodesulfobacteriota bacterium]
MLGELVAHIARGLVERPEAVSVTERQEDSGIIAVELTVAREDLGKVIGKQGRTAYAMRTLLATLASRSHRQAVLRIVD